MAPAKEMLPKIDKSGRFCSPRAARELALYALSLSLSPGLFVFVFSGEISLVLVLSHALLWIEWKNQLGNDCSWSFTFLELQ